MPSWQTVALVTGSVFVLIVLSLAFSISSPKEDEYTGEIGEKTKRID